MNSKWPTGTLEDKQKNHDTVEKEMSKELENG